MGTAYLCSDEATTSALHRAALQSGAARRTALTNVFTGRPARGIVNRLMRELGPDAARLKRLNRLERVRALAKQDALRAAAEARQSSDFTPLWAGQNTSGLRAEPAARITQDAIEAWHRAAKEKAA